MKSVFSLAVVSALLIAVLSGCSSTRRVPEGSLLLDKVKIKVDDASQVSSRQLQPYLRQQPNHKSAGLVKLQLGIYNMAGADTTHRFNRWLRKLGEPPVIYDSSLTEASRRQLQLAMINRGYMDAKVSVDTIAEPRKKKMSVVYNIHAGEGRRIGASEMSSTDGDVSSLLGATSSEWTRVKTGDLLDRSQLDAQRTAVAEVMRNNGYYGFTKESVTFEADTTVTSHVVDLRMMVAPVGNDSIFEQKKIGSVTLVTDFHSGENPSQALRRQDVTVTKEGLRVVYGDDRYIKASTLEGKCFIKPGTLFRQSELDRTYEALTQLGILRSINIVTLLDTENPRLVDVVILLQRAKKQSVTFELEGTNSEGDLGVGGSVTYRHRNLGHRSELLTLKFRANYESISGDFEGFINNRYSEYAAEAGITFPRFLFPFLSTGYKKRMRAVSELALSFNYQERPEYTRIIAGTGWKYRWHNRTNTNRRTLDLVDIQYVYLPRSTVDFINQIAPDNPLLRYSYEDHLIMRMGYTYRHTNRRNTSSQSTAYYLQPTVSTWRASAEVGGNVLYAIASLSGMKRHDGVYKILGVPFSQYVKGEIDWSLTVNLSQRHSLAFRAGGGIAYPYGNSDVVPFEKRFYAGGANGVRGWSVRTLGPGRYDSRNSVTSFINQCGDLSMLLSAEYRAKLFWVLEGGLFVDAGNVWTIKDYPNQPGGEFSFRSFWKEMAWSYGIGLRFDFTYFLFRLDLGMKAYNPAMNQERWPLTHPRWGRDSAIHFSVGYPF